MNNILEIKNLTVYYNNVCALNNINLNIKNGSFLAVLGPNGGGKTTLLKSILGLNKLTSGTIDILNKKINQIGYVPQFSKFDHNFPINVLDVVLSGTLMGKRKFLHKYSKDDVNYAIKILDELEMKDFANRQIGALSGGQLQRILIARALASRPNILILDEPTASLDVNSKIQIYSLLKYLNKNKTIIMVSHDLELISSYVDTIAYINQTLKYFGKPSEYNLLKSLNN